MSCAFKVGPTEYVSGACEYGSITQHFLFHIVVCTSIQSLYYLAMAHYLKAKAVPVNSASPQESVSATVKSVIENIRSEGDSAVRRYSQKFDNWSPTSFKLSKADIENIISAVPEQTLKDIKEVQSNVRAFAIAQRNSLHDFELEIQPGVHLGQKNVPISSVGA